MYLTATIIFVVGELVSLLIFAILKRAVKLPKASPARKASVVKGVLERAVLYIGLLHGFPQILIARGWICIHGNPESTQTLNLNKRLLCKKDISYD
jgi:hypothetical protein